MRCPPIYFAHCPRIPGCTLPASNNVALLSCDYASFLNISAYTCANMYTNYVLSYQCARTMSYPIKVHELCLILSMYTNYVLSYQCTRTMSYPINVHELCHILLCRPPCRPFLVFHPCSTGTLTTLSEAIRKFGCQLLTPEEMGCDAIAGSAGSGRLDE